MTNLGIPFPEGHDPSLNSEKRIVCKGVFDKALKGKEVTLKGVDEEAIREIREILIQEIKRQNLEEISPQEIKG